MKKIIYAMAGGLIISCSTTTDDIIEIRTDQTLISTTSERVSFKDFDEFISTYNSLSVMSTQEEFNSWISKKGHNSLLHHLNRIANDTNNIEISKDTIYAKYSEPFKAILNDKLEFEIDEKVVKLMEDGILYHLPKPTVPNKEHKIAAKGQKIGSIVVYSPRKEKNHDQSRSMSPNQRLTTTKTFNAPNGIGQCGTNEIVGKKRDRKFIHEIYDETIRRDGSIASKKLYLRMRMDGRFCSVWRCKWSNIDDEIRTIELNFRFTPRPWEGAGTMISVNRTFCIKGHLNLVLEDFCSPVSSLPVYNYCENGNNYPTNYIIDFAGTIKHIHAQGNNTFTWTQNVSEFN